MFNVHKWSAHKNAMKRGQGKDCHFCEHWALYHQNNLDDLSSVKIYFLDSCDDPGPAEDGYPLLRKLEEKWMVNLGSLASLDHQQGWNKRDDAKANPYRTAGRNWCVGLCSLAPHYFFQLSHYVNFPFGTDSCKLLLLICLASHSWQRLINRNIENWPLLWHLLTSNLHLEVIK